MTTDNGESAPVSHPSQAEGEDPQNPPTHPDPEVGHPSQAEGEEDAEDAP